MKTLSAEAVAGCKKRAGVAALEATHTPLASDVYELAVSHEELRGIVASLQAELKAARRCIAELRTEEAA